MQKERRHGLGTVTNNCRGHRLATTAKYLRDAESIDLSTTTKYRFQFLCMEPELTPRIRTQNPHQNKFSIH
jgi:hypothetical protein